MQVRKLRGVLAGCVSLGLAAGLCVGTSSTAQAGPNLATTYFTYTGSSATWNVPAGVNSVYVALTGGQGGGQATVTPANTLTGVLTIPSGATSFEVNVGGDGGTLGNNAGGWNGGGSGGTYYASQYNAGGGGGATDLRLPGAPASAALMVAGGSGGGGGPADQGESAPGGAGGAGGLYPAAGTSGPHGDGGAGGAAAVINGPVGGNGENSTHDDDGAGGGGGGGWLSGAGGSEGSAWGLSVLDGAGGGGGGGMSYVNTQYVAGAEDANLAPAGAAISYLLIDVSPISTLAVGVWDSWKYDAGSGATYRIVQGSLPTGMWLDGLTGEVQGVPTTAGSYTAVVGAVVFMNGAFPMSSTVTTTVTVNPGAPADLAATSATMIQANTATLNGSVYAGGTPVTDLGCAISTTDPGSGVITGGTTVNATPNNVQINQTGAPTAVSCPVSGLLSGQLYYFQIVGTQSGVIHSAAATFTTNTAPVQPVTNRAIQITPTSANGQGTISATQSVTNIQCRVATSVAGVVTGAVVPATPASTSGIVAGQPVSCDLTGLLPNKHYYYGVFATDTYGTASSPTYSSFLTKQSPPMVGPAIVSGVTGTTAVVDGSVIPMNESVTSTYCRYIASPGDPKNGAVVAADPFQFSSIPNVNSTSCTLTGLSTGTTYLVRLEATDRDGTGASQVETFTTTGTPAPTPAPAKQTQKPLSRVKLPKQLHVLKKTVLVQHTITTNAGKKVKVHVLCAQRNAALRPTGDQRLCHVWRTKHGRVSISVTDLMPTKVIIRLTAPSTAKYKAYAKRKEYFVRK